MQQHFLLPQWPLANSVRAIFTTRVGGVSGAPFDGLNLADHVGDKLQSVQQNRQLLQQYIGAEVGYLTQTHTARCVDLDLVATSAELALPNADASVTSRAQLACAVLVADCLPVLFSSADGGVVAAAHAGWRGLAAGVLEHTLAALRQKQQQLGSSAAIYAWLGPCIGKRAFEVGAEVRQQFLQAAKAESAAVDACFQVTAKNGFYLADLAALARLRLQQSRVEQIFGNDSSESWCTVTQEEQYFSYRRDQTKLGATGRMAAYIWKTS